MSPLRRQNPREEPGALAAHAGICAGARRNPRPYRDPARFCGAAPDWQRRRPIDLPSARTAFHGKASSPSLSQVIYFRTCEEPRHVDPLIMKILLIDDHALIRDALRSVLRELAGDATVLEASDCRQAMRLIEQHPDLHMILLDLNLPDRDGFAVLSDLRKRYATISIVVLSAFHDRENILRALDLGALGRGRARTPRLARRSRPDRAADGSPRPDDAGQEQQGDLPYP